MSEALAGLTMHAMRRSTLVLLAAGVPIEAQPARAVLQLKWTADSVWEGMHFQKPHRFHVHEELEGRLVFELADSSFLPRSIAEKQVGGRPPVRAIRLQDDGQAVNATLVEAAGTTSYRADVLKEGGDCSALMDSVPAPDALMLPPFLGHEEASAPWDARAPGPALIVFQGAEPIQVAFSPKQLTVQSGHRLLCPKPEAVRKLQRYRVTAQLARQQSAGAWQVETGRDSHGGYTTTGRYRSVVTQTRAATDDPAGATGRLEVTKTFVFVWQPITSPVAPSR